MSGLWVLIFLISISAVPALAVFIWFRLAKYPFSVVQFTLALLAGAAAVFPALILQNFFSNLTFATARGNLFFEVFISIAFTEEFSRLLMLIILLGICNNFMSVIYDSIEKEATAGLIAGFGFAVIEGAIFGLQGTGVLLLRVISAAPLHGACGFRIGSAISSFRSSRLRALFHFFAAVAIHGIYNLMIILPGLPSILAVLIALSALASSLFAIRNGFSATDLEDL